MNAPTESPFKRGDNIAYLLERNITKNELHQLGVREISRMVEEWRTQYPHRFFFTVARTFSGIPEPAINTFESIDQSILFLDGDALTAALPELAARVTGQHMWVILADQSVQDMVRAAITV